MGHRIWRWFEHEFIRTTPECIQNKEGTVDRERGCGRVWVWMAGVCVLVCVCVCVCVFVCVCVCLYVLKQSEHNFNEVETNIVYVLLK